MLFKLSILWYYLRFRWRTFRTRADLLAWQQRQLARHAAFLRQKSPYYAALLQDTDDLLSLPVVNKQTFMEHFTAINTVGIDRDTALNVALEAERSRDFAPQIGSIAVGLSSGTSGSRGVFLVSPDERAQWVAGVLHHVLGFSWRQRRVAFFLRAGGKLYESVRSSLLQFHYYDLSRPFETLLAELERQQPHILVAQPAVLHRIAQAKQAQHLSVSPQKVVSVAEVLEPEVADFLRGVFGVAIQQVYQCTEGFLASTCAHGRLHVHEENLRIQPKWLDAEHTRFHPIVTDFTRRTQPIIRYELNDVLHIAPDACPCGSVCMGIARIEGRQDDMLVFKKVGTGEPVLVFPDFMRKLFLLADNGLHLLQYQMVQPDADTLVLYTDTHTPEQEPAIQQNTIGQIAAFCQQHDLHVPTLRWGGAVVFDPMQKFRRIKRTFSHPSPIAYL